MALLSWFQLPVINDITTDTVNPPIYVELAKQNPDQNFAYPVDFAAKQASAYQLSPLLLSGTRTEVFQKVLEAVNEKTDWELFSADEKEFRIEAVDTTKLMRFKDDIVIEVRDGLPADGKSEVQVRSRSRVGRSDLGANAKRIEVFLKKLFESRSAT